MAKRLTASIFEERRFFVADLRLSRFLDAVASKTWTCSSKNDELATREIQVQQSGRTRCCFLDLSSSPAS